MLTVSMIEDDPSFCELMRLAIDSTGKLRLLGAYSTAEESLGHLPKKAPDVALVDIKLPRMNGIECVRQFRAITPPLSTHFIVLTHHEDDQLVFDAFRAGAHGFLLKDRTSGTELYEAIQDVLTGGAPMSSRIARKVIGFFEQHSRSATSLSGREEEVLRRLEDGLAYKEIAGVLSISVNTVRKHIGSIYQKLHVHSRTAAAKHAATQHQSRQSM